MELTEPLKKIFTETGRALKGSTRRIFMAQVVKALGKGGQRRAETELGWHRRTIRKGTRELAVCRRELPKGCHNRQNGLILIKNIRRPNILKPI